MAGRLPHDDVPGTPDAPDALLAALLDEPPSPEALADPDRAAEYRSALDDVALLRAELRLLGDALAGAPEAPDTPDTTAAPPDKGASRAPAGPPAPEPPGPPTPVPPLRADRPRFRPRGGTGSPSGRPPGRPRGRFARGLMVGVSVAACLAAVVTGAHWWLNSPGTAHQLSDAKSVAPTLESDASPLPQRGVPKGSSALSPEGFVACSRLIVEGRVVRVVEGETEVRVTVDVMRAYKPSGALGRMTFPMDLDADPRLKPDQEVLLTFPEGGDEHPDNWATDPVERGELRDVVVQSLPASRKLSCEDGTAPRA
ncbi:hypothetical protein JNUCC64_23610 [Streptomyces sp. JNUCC 64]